MDVTEAAFRTPHGNWVRMLVREGTSDWNTVNACTEVGDEYQIPQGLTGWALDVGAHIGAFTVALLVDNPDVRCVAIEALPENVDVLRLNLERNGVASRAFVINAGASDTGEPVEVHYSTDPHHEFIGSAGGAGRIAQVPGVTLADVLTITSATGHDRIALAKIDCEGCEYPFLSSPNVGRIDRIVGEVHFGSQQLRDLLDATHELLFPNLMDNPDFGPFEARRLAAEP
jgi:FkbM family methyltransferase